MYGGLQLGLLLLHRAEVTKHHCQALQICTSGLLANIARWVWCVCVCVCVKHKLKFHMLFNIVQHQMAVLILRPPPTPATGEMARCVKNDWH